MDLPDLLKQGPVWLCDWLNNLRAVCRQSRILRNEFFEVHEGPDGTTLLPVDSPSASGSAGGSNQFAFRVIIKNFGTAEAPEWKRGVFVDSPALYTPDHTDIHFPTGRLTDRNPEKTDAGWKKTAVDDYGWLKLTFNTESWPDITAFAIESSTAGDDDGGGELEYVQIGSGDSTAYVQKYARFPLYENTADDKGNPYAQYQFISGPIMLVDMQMFASDATGDNSRLIAVKWRIM